MSYQGKSYAPSWAKPLAPPREMKERTYPSIKVFLESQKTVETCASIGCGEESLSFSRYCQRCAEEIHALCPRSNNQGERP